MMSRTVSRRPAHPCRVWTETSGPSSRWGPCSWRPPRQPGLPALTRRCQKRGAERPSIPSAFVDVREADFDVLDPERHERAFPRRFDRGHCGGKFAVDSPLEEAVTSEPVSEARL